MTQSVHLKRFNSNELILNESETLTIFRSTANPTQGAVKILKSFGKRATKHWFKNANASDLQNARIYEFVRKQISRSFRVTLHDHPNGIAGLDGDQTVIALISYGKRPAIPQVWG